MTSWIQDQFADTDSPYVVAESAIANSYPVGLLTISSLAHNPRVQIIFIAEFEGKVLVGVPKSAWHRKTAQRVLPAGCLSKVTAIETSACWVEDRETVMEGVMIPMWAGYLKAEVVPQVDFLQVEFDAEYTFQGEGAEFCLPHAQALAEAANEHFSFFSATDGFPDAVEVENGHDEPGSADVSSRVSRLESYIEDMAQNMKQLMEAHQSGRIPVQTYGPRSSSARPSKDAAVVPTRKPALRKPAQKDTSSASAFPHLAQDVVQAALQAGIDPDVLGQMSKLVAANPKGAKLGDLNPKIQPNPLSEDEAEEEEESEGGSPAAGGMDPMQEALTKLTSIVATLAEDKKKKLGASKLDSALDHVGSGPSSEGGGLGTGKRSAAARRALRSMLHEHPAEIYQCIERLMWEDISSQTLVPGVSAPSFSCRAWMEHRSRISSYRTLAHAAWGVAGALDCLANQKPEHARARLAVLMLQFDQSAIDRGSWYLASELGLEPGPPMTALEQHKLPSVIEGESPYSKLLDPRWQEVAMSHLKEQEEFVTRRKNLGKSKKEGEEDSESTKRKAKAKAKAKAGAETTA
jgi:hypothetical protein